MGQTLNTSLGDPVPAPNAYGLPSPDVCARRQPSYRMGNRLNDRYDTGVPGPNIYKLPKVIGPNTGPITSTPKAPVYSMGKKLNANYNSGVPGPKYMPKFVDQGKLPASFKFRPKDNANTGIPGPKYDLTMYHPGKKSPAYSMGIRYPDWLDPYIIEDDYWNDFFLYFNFFLFFG